MLSKINLFVALLAVGSLNISNAQNDPKAKGILDELSAKTKAYTSIKAEFSFTTEKKDKTKDVQNGKIETKGKKYKLEIPGHEIYCDGKTVWEFIKDANEVQIKDMETEGEGSINPSNIFTIYEKGFKYKFEGEDATTQTISLFPENPDKKKYHTAKLFVNKGKKEISSVKMLMKDGSTQTYTIKTFTPNAVIADSEFTFDAKAHPGVSIEDLR
jgi:outer membrane lipoprotein-sorting protein